MSVFDPSNPPAQPDSDLDSDLAVSQSCLIQGGTVAISPGDWVDVDPDYINPDPTWGFSFQVSNLYPTAVGILVLSDPVNDVYSETQLSFSEITNLFRRVPKT
jgi:hypothetical protein